MQAGVQGPEPGPTHDNRRAMLDFVLSKGGEVRFDLFAEEHNHGASRGFYSQAVDLTSPGESRVPTPVRSSPNYRNALAQFVLVVADKLYAAKGSDPSKPVQIAEAGGGAGELKREILEVASQREIPLSYISIEPNPRHRNAQEVDGTRVVGGLAHRIPVPDASLDLLFDEEVLDCYPARVLEWNSKSQKFERELYVAASEGTLVERWHPVSRRESFLEHREEELASRGYDLKYYHYAPGHWEYLGESGRVLRSGGVRLSCDYGFYRAEEKLLQGGDVYHELNAVSNPYAVDLTHYVDFYLLAKLSQFHGGFGNQRIMSMMEMFAGHSEEAALNALGRFAFLAVKL